MTRIGCFLLLTVSSLFSCQNSMSPKEGWTRMSEEDVKQKQEEIIQKYVKEGAWKCCNIYSQAWQQKLDEALEQDSTIAYVWQQKAMPLFKQMKYELGMKYLDKAVKFNPDKWMDYRAFMKCIFVKDYTAAIVDFEKCKEEYGNRFIMDHTYDFYIALSLIQLNEFNRAETILTRLIRETIVNDGEGWVHSLDYFYLGISQFEQGNYEESILSFDSSLALYPQFSEPLYYKGLATVNLGDKEEGMTMARLAKQSRIFTINEDNALYERYPYKVNWEGVWWID